MLKITLKGGELWDPVEEVFYYPDSQEITIEHSLVSLSKWESKWKTFFIGNKDITVAQFVDYVRCMTITQNVKSDSYLSLYKDPDLIKQIAEYMADPMTATTINEAALKMAGGNKLISSKRITSELIYYWMTALNIPFECQKWHINRLLTLIKVASIESQPPKKMGKADAMRQQASLNAMRKAQHHTRG